MANVSSKRSAPLFSRVDGELGMQFSVFASTIAANPHAYFLDDAIGPELAALAKAFDEAYSIASDPARRTSLTIADKDAARDRALARFRPVAAQIRNDFRVSDADKAALGITVSASGGAGRKPRIRQPQSIPLLHCVMARGDVHTLRYADSLTPESGSKPGGVTQLFLHGCITSIDQGPSTVHPTQMPLVCMATKNPVELSFPEEQVGMQITLYGRWSTRTGLLGPWSQPLVMTIAVGSSEPNVRLTRVAAQGMGRTVEIKPKKAEQQIVQ